MEDVRWESGERRAVLAAPLSAFGFPLSPGGSRCMPTEKAIALVLRVVIVPVAPATLNADGGVLTN